MSDQGADQGTEQGSGASPTGDIQFEKVEYQGTRAQPATCAGCSRPLQGEYWAVNTVTTCAACKDQAVALVAGPGGGAAGFARFAKATILGVAGGIVGALVWYLVAHFAHMQVGLIAILVGFLVGGGVRLGAQRRGGWLYQLLALGITYASLVTAWFPQAVEELGKGEDAMSGAALYVTSFLFALVAPFVNSVIGALISLFAFYEAWKMNKRVVIDVSGPHRIGAPAPPPLPDAPAVG